MRNAAGGLVFLLLCGIAPAPASGEEKFKVEPGAREMSAEEKALVSDPASGAEHGIVLIEETERIDLDRGREITRHVRAKILSNEGRGLADVSIPMRGKDSTVTRWWGCTILPDGGVVTLEKEALERQELVRVRGRRSSVLRGALPGVVPGCVIDYGYTLWESRFSVLDRVPLQREWPVRRFRYRWYPWRVLPAAFRLYRTGNLAVKADRQPSSVLVSGENLPAVLPESWSPPDNEVRAAASFYYHAGEAQPKQFWDLLAGRVRDHAASFAKERLVKETIASLPIPEGSDLQGRLKAAYDWIGENLTNTDLMTAEQVEESAIADEDESKPGRTLKEVLEKKAGHGWQLDDLFAAMARALGAEVEVILAVDRTDHYLDPALLSADQIDSSLVAVRAPGEPPDKAVIVDPGSGLPYGQIPWWFSGVSGIAAAAKESRTAMLWPSDPRDNVSETTAAISFDRREGVVRASWSRWGTGQHGLAQRRELRPMSPDKRDRWLREYCGEGADVEISRAEAPTIQEATAGFRVECASAATAADLLSPIDAFRFELDGPWFEPIPELTSPTRTHPLVFHFPRVDHAVIEIEAPEGMSDRSVPAPVRLESPFGHYALSARATPKGIRVERTFSLVVLGLPPEQYDAVRSFLGDARRADRTAIEFRRAGDTAP